MKLLKRGGIALLVFFVLLMALLQLAATSRQQAFESEQDSTLVILERLEESERKDQSGRILSGTDAPQETSEISETPIEEDESEGERHDLPSLKRAPSRDELPQMFTFARGAKRMFAAIKLGFAKRMDGALYALKPEMCKVNAVIIAGESMSIGDLDTARTYYREALEAETPPQIHKFICHQLAWLENDPRVIEKLLERACAGDDYDYGLYTSARLADVTGSIELRDHYLERLRKVNPKMARSFDKQSSEPVD